MDEGRDVRKDEEDIDESKKNCWRERERGMDSCCGMRVEERKGGGIRQMRMMRKRYIGREEERIYNIHTPSHTYTEEKK